MSDKCTLISTFFLTSTVDVTQIGKSPHVAQSNASTDARQQKVEAARPRFARFERHAASFHLVEKLHLLHARPLFLWRRCWRLDSHDACFVTRCVLTVPLAVHRLQRSAVLMTYEYGACRPATDAGYEHANNCCRRVKRVYIIPYNSRLYEYPTCSISYNVYVVSFIQIRMILQLR